MIPPIRHYARLVLECVTPLSIASGRADAHYDVLLVRDANDLPAIPGTSLAGVLRHALNHEETASDTLFGYQKSDDGKPSRLQTSWGHIHDSRNRPVEGLLDAERQSDPLLEDYLRQLDQPMIRNRVRISHRGAAADTGKFDRSIVPAGSRFTCEISLQADSADDDKWQQLLDIIHGPDFRLGGNTRAGLGAMKVVECRLDTYDLSDTEQAAAFRARPKTLAAPLQGEGTGFAFEPKDKDQTAETISLELNPTGYWRIGEGNVPHARDNGKAADMLPVTERRIDWKDGRGQLTPQAELLVPATAIKGALRHRFAFHAECLARFHDQDGDSETAQAELFGAIKDTAGGSGHAGRLILDDQYLPIHPDNHQIIMHNVLDRFTGGVRKHLLFSEEMLWDTPLELALHIRNGRELSALTRHALQRALDDLCQGRLALGGSSSRGHGFFEGNHDFKADA